MRWGILGARVAIAAVDLLIVAVIILSILPLANGGLKIDLPQGDVGKPTFENNVVRFSVPVKIYNGGYFDITDLSMKFVLTSDGVSIVDYATVPANIVTGKTTTLDIDLVFDLNTIPQSALEKLVFESSRLDLSVGVEAGYTLGLVKASVHTDQTMNWDPLISNLVIDTNAVQTEANGSNVDILIPYSFGANSMFTGMAVNLDATLRNATAELGASSQAVIVQSYNAGIIRMTVDQQALMEEQDLVVGIDLGFGGATIHRDQAYHWNGVMP